MIRALSIQIPEYAAYDAAFRAYQKLDINNNDVPADVAEAALALVRETHATWKAAAERKAGIHAADCLSQYPLPTGMGNWHCDCGAAIDPD